MIFEYKAAEVVAAFSLSDVHRTFLRDVDVFLDYLVRKPVALSRGKNQPPVKWAQLLNNLLSTPEKLTLKRPMTSHYAQVLGLFLLTRSSCLGRLRIGSKENFDFHINEALYQQWQTMSEVERYFSLLDSWVNCGYAINAGELIRGPDDRFLPGVMMMYGENDLWRGKEVREPDFWLRRGKAFNLAILKMTGLAELHLEDSNRKIRFLRLTPWGQVFLTACQQGFIDSLEGSEFEDDFEQINLLPAIQAIRPDVQRTLELPEQIIAASYLLTVTLGKECSRTLKLSADHTLDELADAILDAFDFDNDHLYHFQYKTDFGAFRKVGHPATYDCDGFTDGTQLRHLHPAPGMKVTFVFDYGDYWEFEIVIMYGSEDAVSGITVTDRKGVAPEQYPEYEDSDY
ncbi:plasmid pRiA4b ORF-3 family protein [Endozoicomonas gorgoniicola]|uniref:Plasmid pRiA4b ORF-3 family protein n=1 Tax=Endozoicomonas gorgoniicola TaxID=1234144 RepID=A0ABT3MV92_9GAMM|nr:plasmid pRiA4b ORF-3 family protein [Endozoicomonas gorgoniicola]MCW7553287.1 plasmid pRiA4b ORF-3 family protein [Endozoicomonas gorgoniicola]